jgi:hypothetical protein
LLPALPLLAMVLAHFDGNGTEGLLEAHWRNLPFHGKRFLQLVMEGSDALQLCGTIGRWLRTLAFLPGGAGQRCYPDLWWGLHRQMAALQLSTLFRPFPWASFYHKSRHDAVPDSGSDRQITALGKDK